MTYEKFKEMMRALGYDVAHYSNSVSVLKFRNRHVLEVSKQDICDIKTNGSYFRELPHDEKRKLLDIAYELAITPIEKREKEKRYRLKSLHFTDTYLLISGNTRIPCVNKYYEGNSFERVIFTEKELANMDTTGFLLEDVNG